MGGDNLMSTIKSSNEHLTFNADGSAKEIRFQANGTQKASISSAGLFTSTTIDATVLAGNIADARIPALTASKLTGALPAIDGSNLTGISAGATGGGSDEVFVNNSQTVTTDYTVPSGKSASSTGPITLNAGVDITLSAGSRWVIL